MADSPPQKLRPVTAGALDGAAEPTPALFKGHPEAHRLLVVGDGVFQIGDLLAPQAALRCQFQILGQRTRIPAHIADEAGGKQHARAVEDSRHAQRRPATVEKAAHEPIKHAHAARDPTFAGILAVAEALADARARAQGVVGGLEKARIHQIVRIEDAEAIVIHFQQMLEGKAQYIALAAHRLGAAQHARPGRRRHIFGIIRAVIGNHPYVEQLARVILRKQRAHGLADHARLVAGGNNGGDALLRRGGGKSPPFTERAQRDYAGKIDDIERAQYIQDQ